MMGLPVRRDRDVLHSTTSGQRATMDGFDTSLSASQTLRNAGLAHASSVHSCYLNAQW